MLKFLAKLVFVFTGWTYDERPDYLEKKQVVIGFPHTSNMDGIRAAAMFIIFGIKTHTIIKKELFNGIFGGLLKKMGGVPVDRSKRSNLVEQMKHEFDSNSDFTLAIAPEATRNKNNESSKPIKTGFWYIAKAANVPIILMLSDNKNKRGKLIGKLYPSESIEDDLIHIRKVYSEYDVDVKIQ